MKKLSLLLLLALLLPARGATLYWPMVRFTGAPNNRQIHIALRSQGSTSGTNTIFGTPVTLQPTNGYATNVLLSAVYLVNIDQVAKTFLMPVPDSTNTYNAFDLITQGTTLDNPAPAIAAGTNVALSTNWIGGIPIVTVSATNIDAGVTSLAFTNVASSIVGTVLVENTNYDAAGAALAATNSLDIANGVAARVSTNRFDVAGAAAAAQAASIGNSGGLGTNNTFTSYTSVSNTITLIHNQTATPYPTIIAARNAAVAGDLIYAVGSFNVNNILTNGVNYFIPNSRLFWQATTTNTPSDYLGIIDDRPCGPTTNIINMPGTTLIWQGYTNLYGGNSLASYGANCLGVVTITNSASRITINCDSIQKSSWLEPNATLTSAVVAKNGQLVLNCNSIFDPYNGIAVTFTNLNLPHTGTKQSRVTCVYWELGTHHINCLSNTPSGLGTYAFWGEGVTTSDVCDFYVNAQSIDGKIYVDSGSSGFRTWITAGKIENTTSNTDGTGTAIEGLGSGIIYVTGQKIMNAPSLIANYVVSTGGGSLLTTNYEIHLQGNPKITTSNWLFQVNGGGSIIAPLDEIKDLAGVNPTNNVIGGGKIYYSAVKNPAPFTPSAITFPNTTVNWTNTFGRAITLFVDDTGVTGTVVKKNGTTIFGTAVPATYSLNLLPYEYFSETYTVGTPSATWTPAQ